MSSNLDGKLIKNIHIGKTKVVLRFNDDSKMDISKNTYLEFKLYPKKELSKKELKAIKDRDALDKYYNFALKSVSSSLQCEKQIRDKLIKKGANKSQIEYIIKELNKYNLIDESALIDTIIEYSNYKLYGENRIREEFKKKGISKEISFSSKEELNKAKKLVIKLDKQYSKYNYESKKQHVYNALLRYGYNHDIIKEVIDDVSRVDSKIELELLRKDYLKALDRYKRKYKDKELDNKLTNYLLSKGYLYKDINKIKGE